MPDLEVAERWQAPPERSRATGRAPARASQAEKYAVPQASFQDVLTLDVARDAELPRSGVAKRPHTTSGMAPTCFRPHRR